MQNLFRRSSGIYVVRMVVPLWARSVVKRTELIRSTGSRELPIAKIVGAETLAGWRRHILNLNGTHTDMDVLKVSVGSPLLKGGGYLPLMEAASASGVDQGAILRAAASGQIGLYVFTANMDGLFVQIDELDHDLTGESGSQYVRPTDADMPMNAHELLFTGVLRVDDAFPVVAELHAGIEPAVSFFIDPGSPGCGFFPLVPYVLPKAVLQVSTTEVEALRQEWARDITPDQVAAASSSKNPLAASKPHKRTSEAVEAFMAERARLCSAEHARRVRAACDLFVELMEDPLVGSIDRDMLKHYRDVVLPTVPGRENQVRAKYKSKTVTESIAVALAMSLPKQSSEEQAKRLAWFGECVTWMAREAWITSDPAANIATRTARDKRKGRDQDRRDVFDSADLRLIFGVGWFARGKGDLTKAGTYRQYLPSYYWLPVLALYTGARVNELCQLYLDDVKQSADGVWFLDLNEQADKKLKNVNSVRLVPVHPALIELGLLGWRDQLARDGFDRLFPELRHDAAKGYSKDAVKWFSRFMRSLGVPRLGKKVFHSFRHTFATECLNRVGLPEATVAQLTGHARGTSVLAMTYKKDAPPAELVQAVAALDFRLPPIAPFDVEAGSHAIRDALVRKQGARKPATDDI